eukprot:7625045-Ditylum_brightwellii.AAC.1
MKNNIQQPTIQPPTTMAPPHHTVPCVMDDENSDDEEDDCDDEIDRLIQPRYNLRMRATNTAGYLPHLSAPTNSTRPM